MLEYIVLRYLNKYFDKILCTNQHGFLRGMSCGTQLITVFHQIFQLRDNGLPVQIAAFDFAKAFDKVSHRLLVEKLHSFNISVQIIEWIKNFLSARKQQVILNDATSDTQMVRSCYIPDLTIWQGSVLGPALFLFYINEIVENISFCVRLFADDIIIMYSCFVMLWWCVPIAKWHTGPSVLV